MSMKYFMLKSIIVYSNNCTLLKNSPADGDWISSFFCKKKKKPKTVRTCPLQWPTLHLWTVLLSESE